MNRRPLLCHLVCVADRRGFTLIELSVVITVICLLVSMVVINASGTMKRFHQQRSLQQLLVFDQRARQLCVSSGRSAVLEVSVQTGEFSLWYADGRWIDAARVVTRSDERMVVLTGKGEQRENATIIFSSAGLSDLYAVGLRNETDENSRWVLFLGSGQVKLFESQADLERWISVAR